MKQGTFIIAEAGVNHNGDLNLALQLVDVAADAGADAVKFQTFVAAQLVTAEAHQAEYQITNLGNVEGQLAMLRKLELTGEMHLAILEKCKTRGIRFMSTAFDPGSVDLLLSLKCHPWKVPSGEITNLPFLRRIGGFNEDVILSTGMANLGEIEAAILALEEAGTNRSRITLLHCTTEYPAPIAEVNLRAMVSMGRSFGTRFGYSDHTEGIEIPVAAVAMGASIIEKHFTVDRSLPGPDHMASLEPLQLAAMIRAIRNVEQALGDGIKRPTASEVKNRTPGRKSIVARCEIRAGDLLTEENLTTKRPGSGISPMRWDEICGRTARRDFATDEPIEV